MIPLWAGLRASLGAVLAVAALAAGGCGDGADGDDSAPAAGGRPESAATAPEREIRAAFDQMQRAFFRGDARGVCAAFTPAVKRQIAQFGGGPVTSCVERFRTVIERDRTGAPGEPRPRIVSLEVDGRRATATVETVGRRSAVPYVEVRGEWKAAGGFEGIGGS